VALNGSKMTLPKTLTLATLALLITITGAREDRQIRWPNQEPVVGLGKDGVQNDQPGIRKKVLEVLGGRHAVQYSEPVLDTDYQSSPKFNPRGMQHVYTLTHMFLDLVQRSEVLPASVNASELFTDAASAADNPNQLLGTLSEHKEELMLQYIGVLTVAVCGVLASIAVFVAMFCVCCCRCAGKCGGYPEHFDKRADSCKRPFFGVILSVFVIAAMFGVVSAFVTNQYSREGVQKLPQRLSYAMVDTGKYFDNTEKEVHALLVTNFEELKEVLFDVLDQSGDILEKSLANAIQEVTLDNLTDSLDELGSVRSHLKTIKERTEDLQELVQQLDLGLKGSKGRLQSAINQCRNSTSCLRLLRENNVNLLDLDVASEFLEIPFDLPDVSLLMSDIQDLVKVKVRVDVEREIGDIRPDIKKEIKRMGVELSEKAAQIQHVLNEFDGSLQVIQNDIPRQKAPMDEYIGGYMYYIGFGMSLMVLLVLICYVLGLFYGFCGNRPGNVYGDDCCNRGTGANWLLAAVYLTFLFSCVLLLATTAQFLVGSTLDKVGCEALDDPKNSELFGLIDDKIITPHLEEQIRLSSSGAQSAGKVHTSLRKILGQCHRNSTLYVVMQSDKTVYDVDRLREWRREFGFDQVIQDLSRKIVNADLKNLQLLSPEAEDHLRKLAESKISDLNFDRYTDMFDRQITRIDLQGFISSLEWLSQRSKVREVRAALGVEVRFLQTMVEVVEQMKGAMEDLKKSTKALEEDVNINKEDFRRAINQVIKQAKEGPEFLQQKGPGLINKLANDYIDEAVGLIDGYVDRVIGRTKSSIGQCGPVSLSYNATVDALCREVVDPFNGFWASVGWCVVLYLFSVALALPLVSLYRKSEPYPGPLVERNPTHGAGEDHQQRASSGHEHQSQRGGSGGGGGKKSNRKRGHRRNPSEYLPDSAHAYRAGYSYQASADDSETNGPTAATAVLNNRFQDAAPRNHNGGNPRPLTQISLSGVSGGGGVEEQPPRYISNPNLVNLEGGASTSGAGAPYERPPPYYYPGASAPPAGTSDVPPPLPPPNRS